MLEGESINIKIYRKYSHLLVRPPLPFEEDRHGGVNKNVR